MFIHRLIAKVFKVLGLSIIFMFVLDTSLMAVDTIMVHNKITSLAWVIQSEIARNNCVPNALADMFESRLQNIVDNSNVAAALRTNIKNNLTVDGKFYTSLSEANVKDYGELQTLVINVEMRPSRVYFRTNAKGEFTLSDITRETFSYDLTYEYVVPCLRYLK